MAGPLADCLVVELGSRTAVSACGSLLAQLGAQVVLIEPAAPAGTAAGRSRAGRSVAAAGKRSLVARSLSTQDDDALGRLVASATVVLLSTDEGDAHAAIWDAPRPAGQILCDITAFGTGTGTATEADVELRAGIAATTGRPDGPPELCGAPVVELEAAVYAASAILAALRVRRRHGAGQRIEVALYDVAVNALAAFLPLAFAGRPAGRDGNRHPFLAPWNSYRATDGWVVICAPTGDQWSRLCAAMDRPGLAGDPRFATTTARLDHIDALDAVVAHWVSGRSVEECLRAAERHVIPCGPVTPVTALGDEPNLRRRAMVLVGTDPESGERVLLPGCPVRWDGGPVASTAIPRRDDARATVDAVTDPAGRTVTGDPPLPGRPLDGIRVVEVGMNTVGPLAAKQLGALGADVIKVEPPRGDSNRHNAPLRADGEAYIFALLNTDKRGLVLDLRDAGDRQRFRDLLATADVLVENLKPGSLGRLGFGPADVRAGFPDLIYCSANGFGHDTVYPDRPALDTVVQAMSGLMDATRVDGVPMKVGISAADQFGGLFALLGVLAAIEGRERGGSGAALDIAMHDATAWATHPLWNDPRPPAATRAAPGPAGAAATGVADVLADPHTIARDLLVRRPTAEGSTWTVLAPPIRLRSTPATVRTVMSRLGVTDPALAAEFPAPVGAES